MSRSYMGRWETDYERFGVSLDFSDPYLPYKNDYIETAWQVFKTISDKGFLYKDKKTLIYCPHCETPLSQGSMEVEYAEDEDPSIFFTFEIDAKRSKPKIGLGDRTYLLVWTTTPWTIPSNVAVAANPKALYVRANARWNERDHGQGPAGQGIRRSEQERHRGQGVLRERAREHLL